MEFCLFLVRRGYVTAEQAIEVFEQQVRRREPIGRLALKGGVITVRQVVKILESQALAHPRQRFGDTGVALGFMTDDQVQELLRKQYQLIPQVEELLVDQGTLSYDEVEQAREQFQARIQAA